MDICKLSISNKMQCYYKVVSICAFAVIIALCGLASSAAPTPMLCTDMVTECGTRAQKKVVNLTLAQQDLYACIVYETTVSCTEEYLCTCVAELSQLQVRAFSELFDQYTSACSKVPGSHIRTNKDLKCLKDHNVTSHENLVNDGILEEAEDVLTVESTVEKLNARCPGYASCHYNYTSQVKKISSRNLTTQETFQLLCRASKESLACTEKVLCACGQGNNPALKMVLRQIRHNHESSCNEDLNIGYLRCNDTKQTTTPTPLPTGPPSDLERLCTYPVTACEERQAIRQAMFKPNQLNQTAYVVCELTLESMICIEDYLCECPGMNSAELVLQYDDAMISYRGNCSNVVGHVTKSGNIRCKSAFTNEAHLEPKEDVIFGEIESSLDLKTKIKNIDLKCPGYDQCYNLTQAYNARAMATTDEEEQVALVCQGSRLFLECLNDKFCQCGLNSDLTARQTIRKLRHYHEEFCDQDLVFGFLNCADQNLTKSDLLVGQGRNLCINFLETCDQRVISHYSSLKNKDDKSYVSCENFKVQVQCYEEMICNCPYMNTQEMQNTLHDYKRSYESFCKNVSEHVIRTGDIYCKDQEKLDATNPGQELIAETEVKEMSLQQYAGLVNTKCTKYEKCLNLTKHYSAIVYQTSAQPEKLTISCEGSKYSIICLEDALCECGLANNSDFKNILENLRIQHSTTCGQELTIGYLTCLGTTAVGISYSWMILFSFLVIYNLLD
ncbi:uncharacterized protein LOC131945022 isoform X3 [Physella acuta]|uniref:uncharacterized protein LOC131945022 isoform X3 n=1 Tax=Physella acuta TaxID=109671 RepID=UPI0027DC81E8|nr:uncharacterized protein LOC131945022 isoform X3 [Physella acuta]